MFSPGQTKIDLGSLEHTLSMLPTQIRTKALKPAVKAAGQNLASVLRDFANWHRSAIKNPVFRKGRRIGQPRQHFADTIITKVWTIPNQHGYVAYAGPKSGEAPHAHLLERGTVERFTKTGAYRGRGPAYHILSNTIQIGIPSSVSVFFSTLQTGLQNVG